MLNQAAHLHAMLASNKSIFFEIPFPEELFQLGMKDKIKINKEGYIEAPQKPGLGFNIDLDKIKELSFQVIEIKKD